MERKSGRGFSWEDGGAREQDHQATRQDRGCTGQQEAAAEEGHTDRMDSVQQPYECARVRS